MAVDGASFDVADSDDKEEYFHFGTRRLANSGVPHPSALYRATRVVRCISRA
jgi:hypothetical protein